MKTLLYKSKIIGLSLVAFLMIAGYAQAQTNCVPDSLAATNVTAHTADLAWAGISGPTHVRYYPTGTTNYRYMFTTANHVMIGRLLPETAYSWDLNNFCDGHWTQYSGNGAFTTLADTIPPPTCIPTDLTATNVTAHTADLAWAGISGPTHVRYYPTGTTNYRYMFTTTDHVTIRRLLPETAYSWDLNNFCDGHWTEYSGNGSFTTLADMFKAAVVDETDNTPELSGLTVYPNPVKTGTVVTFNSENHNDYTWQVLDITGRTIARTTLQATSGINTFELDLTGHSKGIYLLNIQKGAETKHIKLIKE